MKLINRSEPVEGALYRYCIGSLDAEGLSLLLTHAVIHPAFYCLDDIESLHIGSVTHEGERMTEAEDLFSRRGQLLEAIASAADGIRAIDDRLEFLRSIKLEGALERTAA